MSTHPAHRNDPARRAAADHAPGTVGDVAPPVLVISCDTCVMRLTDACDDCMMSALCGHPANEAVVISLEELREIRLLAKAGLVPTLRHRAIG